VLRTEAVVGGFFLACWIVALFYASDLVALPRPIPIDLYGLFTFSAAFGWVAGNLYVLRRRRLPAHLARRFRGLYLFVPAGLVALVRAMTTDSWRAAAPLGGLYALLVYAIFFGVPLLLSRR
jgi:hypothetical protein